MWPVAEDTDNTVSLLLLLLLCNVVKMALNKGLQYLHKHTYTNKEKDHDIRYKLNFLLRLESENDRVVEFVNHTHSSGVTILLVSGPPVHLQGNLNIWYMPFNNDWTLMDVSSSP